MTPRNKETIYRATVAITFGGLGFFCNFHTIIFPFGGYTVAVLFGLLFPLLIALGWGWKYGLLSALAGGCQTMWWLWGPSNGYAVFLVVPPFTFWIIWHGYFACLRSKAQKHQWWLNMYVIEIPFRILCTINLLTFSRWAIALNPPPWNWAANAISTIPMTFSIFVAVKQACVAMVLLLCADVLLNIGFVRAFFKLNPIVDQRRTGYIVSIFILIGCLFWLLDSLFHAFASDGDRTFIDLFALDIPESNLFTRVVFLMSCMAAGLVTSKILRKQKQSEMALRKAREAAVTRESFLRTLVRSIPDLVWLKDPQGVYLACNSRFERFFGAKETEIVGKTDYAFLDRHEADLFKKRDMQTIARGRACTSEEEITFADDGHREHLETIKTPMFNDDGELIGVLGIGRNITERLNLQAQLVQAQKMESVGRLAGGVAHDFNNMLSVIRGNAELLLDDIARNSPLVESLHEIVNAAERSSSLTRQLLAFARRQTIAPEVINLNDAIEGILKMLRRLIGEDIELTWIPAKEPWPVKMDPSQIDQILANLCVNSRDSIKSVGKVTIEIEKVSLDAAYCQTHDGFRHGDFVLMTVSDTGRGMTRETMDHIFEPFYTTKTAGKGTGLGLATVYGIMKQNDGFINVYSEPGKGSVFKVYFPRHTGTDLEKSRPSPLIAHPTGWETILVVEDEQSILRLLKKRLEKLGYAVLDASSPKQALDMTRTSGPIHLLLTDVVMPEMNGRDLAQIIMESHPETKCLFMSGYTANVIAHHGILDEGLHFINKPFSIKDLSVKLRKILDSN